MKKYLFFLVLTTALTYTNGQIKVVVPNEPNMPDKFRLYLRQYVNMDFVTVDSIDYRSADSIYTLPRRNCETGLFAISIRGEKNQAEFIYNPQENLTLSIHYWHLKNGEVEIENSKENEAYSRALYVYRQSYTLIEDLEHDLNTLHVFMADFKRRTSAIEDSVEDILVEHNALMANIKRNYPATYTGTTLIPIMLYPMRTTAQVRAAYDGYRGYFNQHYFDSVDVNAPYINNHYALGDKIVQYLDRYTEKSTTGAEAGVDAIMNGLNRNPTTESFAYNLLLKSFLSFKTETLAKYLVDNYSGGCSLNLTMDDLKRLNKMQALTVGGDIPDILSYDEKGSPQSLKNYLKSKKYTVVYFWISWCAHCQKNTPKLVDLYNLYKNKGLGVFAVSLDDKKEDWLNAVANYKADWMNVCELVPIKNSTFAPNFNVSTTPKIYIVDSKGKVVAKDLYGEKLEEFVKGVMK